MKGTPHLFALFVAVGVTACAESDFPRTNGDSFQGDNDTCYVGEAGCSCNDNGRCDAGAVCISDMCEQDSDSSLGDHGQACYADNTCDGSLSCVGALCVFDSETTIANNLNWPERFLVDNGTVYWSDRFGSLNSMPLGVVGTFSDVADVGWGGFLAVDSTYLYWNACVDGLCPTESKIMRAPKDFGSTPEVLASNRRRPGGLKLDGTQLYWVEHGEYPELDRVVTMSATGGSVQTVEDGVNGVQGLAIDDTYVFYTNAIEYGSPTGWGVVTRATKPTGTPAAITSDLGSLRWIGSDNTSLFWTNASGEITTADRDGNNASVLATHPRTIGWMIRDDAVLYWSDEKGGVYKMPTSGGTPEELIAPDLATYGTGRLLATDDDYLYLFSYFAAEEFTPGNEANNAEISVLPK